MQYVAYKKNILSGITVLGVMVVIDLIQHKKINHGKNNSIRFHEKLIGKIFLSIIWVMFAMLLKLLYTT